ncbi:MAG: hypothetical protein ABL994_20865, partial [Verrucomicrobiales bacterium]
LLTPSSYFSDLFPAKTVFAPRTSMEDVVSVIDQSFRLDTLTGTTLVVMGEMPLICHRCVATPPALEFFKACGLPLPKEIRCYETEEEAVSLAIEAARRGDRIAYFYPPPAALKKSPELLIPVPIYNRLNDKANLGQLVDSRFLPRYELFAPDDLSGIGSFLPDSAIFVKGCRAGASGAGQDVLFCPDPASRGAITAEFVSSRPSGMSAIRVEEAVALRNCWCLSLGISESGIRYLGGATQLFGEPGHQTGSRVDFSDPPPPSVVDLALGIAGRARELGYLGVVGFDLGVTSSDQPFVFDLNFRAASSTTQVLLHESATRRIGGSVSQSWAKLVPGPLPDVIRRLEPFARSGHFVPFRLCEATTASEGLCVISGMLISGSVAGIESLEAGLNEAL